LLDVWLCDENTFQLHKRTNDWRPEEIVDDVPIDAGILSTGTELYGSGSFWFDFLKFEEVGRAVPLTRTEWKDLPCNLDFSALNPYSQGKVCGQPLAHTTE
jgi:hypothetical protein